LEVCRRHVAVLIDRGSRGRMFSFRRRATC